MEIHYLSVFLPVSLNILCYALNKYTFKGNTHHACCIVSFERIC